MRTGPRGIDAIFIGFSESHGVIDNSAMLIPLEPLLTGIGSIALLRTHDYNVSSPEPSFLLARLREWNLMLRGARLVADCSKEDYQNEVDKLTDPTTPYTPKIIFERPVVVSHQMQ